MSSSTIVLAAGGELGLRLEKRGTIDRLVPLPQELIDEKAPNSTEDMAFFSGWCDSNDRNMRHWEALVPPRELRGFGTARPGLLEACRRFDRIEILVGPDVRDQLILLQLIDQMSRDECLCKRVHVVQSEISLNAVNESSWLKYRPEARLLGRSQIELAHEAWAAFGDTTPLWWCSFARANTTPLPFLGATILRLAAELPSTTNGLGFSEERLLRNLSVAPVIHARELIRATLLGDDLRVTYGPWQFAKIVDVLGLGPEPAIARVRPSPLEAGLISNRERWGRHRDSLLTIKGFGHRLLDGTADFAVCNRVDRWWGGTHLTNAELWRWDREKEVIVAP